MKKSELRQIIREEVRHLMNESNRNIGHFKKIGGQYYVDSNFLNLTKGVLPGSSLEHMGFGEFYLSTSDGRIYFIPERGRTIKEFVGRVHTVHDEGGKIIDKLIKAMVKAKKAEEV